jgi:hypothetical protein
MTDPLTPEVLARWEELAANATEGPWDGRVYDGVAMPKYRLVRVVEGPNEYGFDRVTSLADYLTREDAEFVAESRTMAPALLSGVRSRDARIAELEAEVDRKVSTIHDTLAPRLNAAEARIAELEAEVAARDAVIAMAPHADDCEVTLDEFETKFCDCWKSAAPSSVLAARDAEKWDEGFAANVLWPATPNPYRAGADQ